MKTIIFDLDGTLADSKNLLIDVALSIVKKHLPANFNKNDLDKYRDKTPRQIIDLLKINKLQLIYYVIKGRKIIKQRRRELKPVPEIEQILKNLVKAGYQLKVASSNSKFVVDEFLKNNNLEHYFSGTWGRLGFFSKASGLNKILNKLNIKKKDAIYIGDELKDINSCKEINIKCISVIWGLNSSTSLNLNNPGMVVNSVEELEKKIKFELEIQHTSKL